MSRSLRPHCLGLVLTSMAALATSNVAADTAPRLLWPTESSAAVLKPSPGAVSWTGVAVDTHTLAAAPTHLTMELLPGFEIAARAERIERRGADDLVWRGRVVDDADSQVVLTLRKGLVVGAIFLSDTVYEVSTSPAGPVVSKLDSALFPPCGGSPSPEGFPSFAASSGTPSGRALLDTPDQTDVIVMYTPQARDAAGGVPQIEATAQAAVDMANTAFANSDMVTRFRMVYTGLANRNDSGNISSDLSWLRNDATVAALRNTYGADMVGMLVENGAGACGVGYLMGNVDASTFGPSGFQITARTCAVGNLTYAHEHGHNMGLSHDPANAGAPGSLYQPDGYGHFHNGVYRTVLSYNNQCGSGCTRHPYFSNPAISFMGLPTGILNERDNHRVGNLTAPFVANWRAAVVLFTDGFESGDITAWTSSVP
jgi:peptidyl-Asp metalloendopeptidase